MKRAQTDLETSGLNKKGGAMAVIRYVGGGGPKIQIDYSMNNGQSWQKKELMPGQSFPIPPNCTTLLVNNVPYDPRGDYEIRDGKVGRR